MLARDGLGSRRALHQALNPAADQHARWREMSQNGSGPSSVAGLDAAMSAYEQLRNNLAAVAMCAKIGDLDRHSAREIETTLRHLDSDRQTLHRIPTLNRLNDRLTAMGLGALLDELARRVTDAPTSASILRWAWLNSLLDEFRLTSSHLSDFTGVRQSRVVSEYCQADLSLDPPTHSGRSFSLRFLHEEFSGVNRGAGVLPLALPAACPGFLAGGRGSGGRCGRRGADRSGLVRPLRRAGRRRWRAGCAIPARGASLRAGAG